MEVILTWTGLSGLALAYCFFWGLVAGVCRGFAGFGLSAIIVTSLTLVLAPREVVPIALMLEMISSLIMLKWTWGEVRWKFLSLLLVSAAIGTPFGVWLLTWASPDSVRIGITFAVLIVCVILWRGLSLRWSGSPGPVLGVGLISGVANGAASLGGLPVAIFLLAAVFPVAALRATLNLFFLIINAYGTGVFALSGLIDQTTIIRTAFLVIPATIGIFIGHYGFKLAAPETFRKLVLGVLTLLASSGLIRALI